MARDKSEREKTLNRLVEFGQEIGMYKIETERTLKAAIKAANTTQEKWSATQGISEVTVSRMVTRGCVVINGRVYSPTKYTVEDKSDEQ